ncbi:MAG: succinylglutamate desuccinylase/aspartoacylase family protein [Parcubacteria group bacterium]
MKSFITKVGSVTVRAGKWSRGTLSVAKDPNGRIATIPLWIAAGRDVLADKRFVVGALLGGAHGDESNGPELVNRVCQALDPAQMHGMLMVLPVMNPWGFAERMRMVPYDQRDLNRCYPGHSDGSFTLKVAHTILNSVVRLCDFVIDVHDAGTRIVLVPHARVHIKPPDDPSVTLGMAFGSDVVLLRQAEPGMLAGEARKQFGTNVVSLEIGGALQVSESIQERATAGVLNILKSQGLVEGQLVLPPHQHLLKSRHTCLAELSGIQTTYVQLGQVVAKGEPLYRILDPLTGKQAMRRAEGCGVVLARNLSAQIDKGAPSIAILEFSSCEASAILKTNIVHNRSDRHTVVLKSAQGWSHRSHHL